MYSIWRQKKKIVGVYQTAPGLVYTPYLRSVGPFKLRKIANHVVMISPQTRVTLYYFFFAVNLKSDLCTQSNFFFFLKKGHGKIKCLHISTSWPANYMQEFSNAEGSSSFANSKGLNAGSDQVDLVPSQSGYYFPLCFATS